MLETHYAKIQCKMYGFCQLRINFVRSWQNISLFMVSRAAHTYHKKWSLLHISGVLGTHYEKIQCKMYGFCQLRISFVRSWQNVSLLVASPAAHTYHKKRSLLYISHMLETHYAKIQCKMYGFCQLRISFVLSWQNVLLFVVSPAAYTYHKKQSLLVISEKLETHYGKTQCQMNDSWQPLVSSHSSDIPPAGS